MAIYSAKDFGQIIKERRKELGYTQAKVCELTGFSASFVSDLENGKKTIEFEKSIKLANLLGLNFELTKRD